MGKCAIVIFTEVTTITDTLHELAIIRIHYIAMWYDTQSYIKHNTFIVIN